MITTFETYVTWTYRLAIRKSSESILFPFFSLPFLQAGDDEILKAMGRGHTVEQYLQIIDRIRMLCPDAAITADVIVSCSLYIYVYIYSCSLYIYMYMYKYIFIYIYIYIYIDLYILCIHIHIPDAAVTADFIVSCSLYIYMNICIYIHIYIYSETYYVYTYIYLMLPSLLILS